MLDLDNSSGIDDFFVSQAKRTRVASISDLSGYMFLSANKLVHIAQQDFWKLGHDENGFYVERLVEDNEGPVQE